MVNCSILTYDTLYYLHKILLFYYNSDVVSLKSKRAQRDLIIYLFIFLRARQLWWIRTAKKKYLCITLAGDLRLGFRFKMRLFCSIN